MAALLIVMSAIYSCNFPGSRSDIVIVREYRNAVKRLSSSVLLSSDSLIALKVVYHDGFLYAANASKNSNGLFIYDLQNGEEGFTIHKGRAYGEVISMSDLAIDRDDSRLMALDIFQQKVVSYPLAGISTGSDPRMADEIRIEKIPVINSFCCGSRNIFAAGNIPGVRAIRLSLEGKVDTVATYSPGTKGGEYDRFLAEAYLGRMAVSKSGSNLVLCCRYADQMEIIDLARGGHLIVKGPDVFEPQYEVVNDFGGTLSHKREERMGYLDVKITGNSIFLLYSGLPLSARQAGGQEIREFSLSGEYLGRYLLEDYILSFDVSDDHRLFATTEDGKILELIVEG